jgi:hypothetical protein
LDSCSISCAVVSRPMGGKASALCHRPHGPGPDSHADGIWKRCIRRVESGKGEAETEEKRDRGEKEMKEREREKQREAERQRQREREIEEE